MVFATLHFSWPCKQALCFLPFILQALHELLLPQFSTTSAALLQLSGTFLFAQSILALNWQIRGSPIHYISLCRDAESCRDILACRGLLGIRGYSSPCPGSAPVVGLVGQLSKPATFLPSLPPGSAHPLPCFAPTSVEPHTWPYIRPKYSNQLVLGICDCPLYQNAKGELGPWEKKIREASKWESVVVVSGFNCPHVGMVNPWAAQDKENMFRYVDI